MGCVESAQPKKPAKPASRSGDSGKRLLEEYAVGSTIGEGAFGVVSNCTKLATGEQLAVKMIDKVETPVHAIKKEAETLQRLSHPNIVKVHGVFYERCFVCIVMDKFSGGDLVEGLQGHLKERGPIDCFSVLHVARQMGSSLQYLHGESIVHRDVKGDNYLMSVPDITHADNRIVLADFGTATEIRANERLSAGVGTKIFWPPEFYDKSYGPKVDVWAMGVIMYGLVSGRFPFKDERDIRGKEVRIPKRVHPVCQDFIRRMLEKEERKRLSSDQVMQHKWITQHAPGDEKPHEEAKHDEDDATKGHDMREANVNDGIKERRQELISRLNKEKKGPQTPVAKTKSMKHLHRTFYLSDKITDGACFEYEWWNAAKIEQSGLLSLEGVARPLEDSTFDAHVDINHLKHTLEEHNIGASHFGEGNAKTLMELAKEVHSGSCRLMLDATQHKKLVRVVDVVLLRITDESKRLLVETEERFADGRTRTTLRLPGTKREPHNNMRQTAILIMKDRINLTEGQVQFDMDNIQRVEEEEESISYPGVTTVYRLEIVQGKIKENPGETWSATLKKDSSTKSYAWMPEATAQEKGVKLHNDGPQEISTLVRAPVGMSEEALSARLTKWGLDVTRYGQPGETISLKDLSGQLIRGEARLARSLDGQPLRVVDVVLLIITNPSSGDVLVQTGHAHADGSRTALNRLPGNKCRPDENHFLTARRIVRRQLEIDDDDVCLSQDVKFIEEEAVSAERRQQDLKYYCGLKTVYRKRLIKAEVVVPAAKK